MDLPIPNSSERITASKKVFSSNCNKLNSNSTINRGAFVAKP